MTVDAVTRLSDLVEAAQRQIARVSASFFPVAHGPTVEIIGLVHQAVRGISAMAGDGVKAALASSGNNLEEPASTPVREALLAVLNGVFGDHLAATGNPLAIPMRIRQSGCPLKLESGALAAAIPESNPKILVFVHGLCRNDLQWAHEGRNRGAALARDLGYTPVYLHYNSGLHVSENGEAFADLLERAVRQWPVKIKELTVIAHSAGGLVARSACHYGTVGGHRWRRLLRHLFFVGTPHHGAPLERWGNLVNVGLELSAFSAPYARLAKIRSAGITDLRYGNLRHEDWLGRDCFAHCSDVREPLPLPNGVRCYALAAVPGRKGNLHRGHDSNDGLVPLSSALGQHVAPAMTLGFPESRQWIGYGMNHWDLLRHPRVYERIGRWLRQ